LIQNSGFYRGIVELSNLAVVVVGVDAAVRYHTPEAGLMLAGSKVNDLNGHQGGDQVLRCVAERLSALMGGFGSVARVGGDEFAALLPDIDPTKGRHLLEAACRAISMPLDGLDLRVTATCGVASSAMAKHWRGLLQRAELALYEAKRSKRGGVSFYQGDEPGRDQRRWREREALLASDKTVGALKSDVVRLEQETRHDRRTGLLNAAAFEEDLPALHALAGQLCETYSIVLCDIDFFHKYNTRYLYQPANVTLRRVADAIKGACRPGDSVYRYGGEEVIIALRRTNLSDAGDVAARVRCAVAELAIPHENRPDPRILTISVGVAGCDPSQGLTAAAVVDAANRALILAKQSGRNRVEISDTNRSSRS
jgi:diguanylate cyclase (GGDEF)-like protein